MEYVSAEWVIHPTGERSIKAVADDGTVWWVPSAESDVPPWPDFLEKQGLKAIKPARAVEAKPAPEKKGRSK